jgi:hypothetical protein
MDSTGILIIAIVAFICIYFSNRSKTMTNPVNKPGSFSQAGVMVEFEPRTIAINGNAYSVDAVRGLRWESANNQSVAYITVTDLAIPIHKIEFGGRDTAQVFIARLEAALDQAGGPHFH